MDAEDHQAEQHGHQPGKKEQSPDIRATHRQIAGKDSPDQQAGGQLKAAGSRSPQ
jgi:hypothetical protein